MDTSYVKGLRYELIVKAIFQEILDKASDVDVTLRIEHLAMVQGLKTCWKIDVLWEFQVGGIRYLTIVQAKNWNKRVSQEHVGAFEAVLRDIPGQPRGIMVSRKGFQEGAENLARALGILLYRLAPVPKIRLVLRNYGWGTMRINPKTLHLEGTAFNPRVVLTLKVPHGTKISPDTFFKTKAHREYFLFDEHGKSLGTMRDVVAELVDEMKTEGKLSDTRTHVFRCPTFFRHEQGDHQIPVDSVTAEISVTPDHLPPVPLLPQGLVAFVLTNLQTGESSTYSVASHPETSP